MILDPASKRLSMSWLNYHHHRLCVLKEGLREGIFCVFALGGGA